MGLTLSAYDHEVHYKPSTNHCNTDTLFRLPLDQGQDWLNYVEEIVFAGCDGNTSVRKITNKLQRH